jgi:phage tail sheath gpL-like
MTVNVPIVKFENLPATPPTTLAQQKLLFICQKTAAGTAVEGELYTQLETDLDYEGLAGKDSMGAAMIRAAQKRVENSERKPQFDAIFFDDAGASVAAVGNIIFANDPTSATADRTIYVTIGDEDQHEYKLDVKAFDTATVIGDALKALIDADDTVPMTAINTAGDVALTAKNKGEEGNKLTLQVKGYVPGITISITQPTGGSGTPDISGVPTTIQNLRYQTIVMPETYDYDSIADFLDTRWPPSPTGIIKDGALIVCLTDTLANLKTSTDVINKKVVGLFPNKPASIDPVGHSDLVIKGAAHPQMNYVIAAKIAAIRALRFTNGADITQYTNAVLQSRDNTGGIHISTLPYHNIPLTDVPLADQRNVWTEEETLELIDAGYAIFGNNVENTAVLIGTVATRYEKNDEGKTDLSYKYLNYLDQTSVVREYFTVNLKETYKNHRLTSGVVVPDENMVDAGEIKAECIKLYGDLADLGIMVKGQRAKQLFIDSLIITEFDEALGRITLKFKNPIVTQVREITGDIQLTFTTS